MIKAFVLVCVLSQVWARTSPTLKVALDHGGVLVGRHLLSVTGRPFRAFMGIPYAEPPIGELRFKAPVAASPWSGERQAVEDENECIQRNPYFRECNVVGSEDCLYLNVYTPSPVKDELKQKPLPVMVWFHGGGWMCGSGTRHDYGPEFLLNHDIVLVSGNYRVGPLGFLSTGTEDCPGNNGLKDQVQILKWVQENIAQFGGDPDQVTIFGESAGGATGTYLMMSPLSKGLFSKVIAQSGANLDSWAQPAHEGVAPTRALRLGEMLGCKADNDIDEIDFTELIECLRTKEAEDITKANYAFFEWDMDPMIPFPPVVEPDLPGAYITKHPREEVTPHGLSLPLMIGITRDEGAMKSAAFLDNSDLMDDLNENWNKALPIMLYYDHLPKENQQEITDALTQFYFNNEKASAETGQNFTNMVSDGWFWHGIENYLRIRLEQNEQSIVGPTFVYLFTQKGEASLTEMFKGGLENYYGVCHADDLQYLFPIGVSFFMSSVPSRDELKMMKIMTKIWVDFAKTGNPTPNSSKGPKWEPATGFPLKYYRLGRFDEEDTQIVSLETGLLEERAALWNKYKPHLAATNNEDHEMGEP